MKLKYYFKMLYLASFLIPFAAHADTIKCYNGKKLIYSHHVENLTFEDNVFAFNVVGNPNMVVIISGNCIAKLDVNQDDDSII